MTNLQLLLTIGIPSLLILVTLVNNNVHFNFLEKRMSAIEARLIAIEADLRRCYEMWGKHEGEIGILKEHMK